MRKNIVLNEDQEEAVKYFKKFFKSEDRMAVLCGVGGTGKTTVIYDVFARTKIINDKKKEYIPSSVIGVTVTHQARINLSKSIPNTTTFASATNQLMGVTKNGEIYFYSSGKANWLLSELRQYKYIVVDECSMFSQKMMDEIINCANPTAKILYMGDHHQLPPIEREGHNNNYDSPSFSLPWKYELTKKVRQDQDSDIARLSDEVCLHIDTDYSLDFLKSLKTSWNAKTGKGYALSSFDAMIKSYVKNFKAGDEVRITSYHNEACRRINDIIRAELWGDDAFEERFVIGEYIVMSDQFNPEGIPLAYNGQTFIVEDVNEGVVDFIKCTILMVYNGQDIISLPIVHPDSERDYKIKINELKKHANRMNDWQPYMQFKNQFANVSYAYCVTNYKIQGSTIKGCYVNLGDIMSAKYIDDRIKLQAFYVGVSRPTHYLGLF